MPQVEYTDYYSHILGRKINIQITGHFGHPIIMFPTSQGSLTQNSDFHLNGSIDHFTDSGKVKLLIWKHWTKRTSTTTIFLHRKESGVMRITFSFLSGNIFRLSRKLIKCIVSLLLVAVLEPITLLILHSDIRM